MFWASPVRKSGTAYLSPIPNEIYMEIFSYLRPTDPNEWIDDEARQHFRNLALVCRFFSSVMLPWIFENLTFVEKDSYSQISSPLSSTVSAKFCRNILDGDTMALLLAKHVKRWAFSGSPTQSKWTPAFLSMYFETFQHLANLLELSLSNIIIPKDFFKHLANVPTLEALKLENSSFDGGVRDKHLKHFESLSLKRLALLDPKFNKGHLKRLVPHLNMTSLIHLELDLIAGLQGLSLSNSSLPLESLQLYGLEDSLRIAKLLEHTPYLKLFHVWLLRHDHRLAPDFVLKPQVIPQLTELGASWPFCTHILPGRPISRLKLSPLLGPRQMDEVKIFAGSTKSVIQLEFPIYRYPDVPFWEHFPELERLGVRSMGFSGTAWRKAVNVVFQKWNRHPNLRSLCLEFIDDISVSAIDAEEKQVLEFLNTTFPVLTNVKISFASPTVHSWTRRSCPTTYNAWSYTRAVGGSWHRTFRIARDPF